MRHRYLELQEKKARFHLRRRKNTQAGQEFLSSSEYERKLFWETKKKCSGMNLIMISSVVWKTVAKP